MKVPNARRRGTVAFVVAFCVIGVAACTILATDRAVRIDYYRVVETATTVTITVKGLEAPIRNGAGGGQGVEFIVKLRDPIGSRTVVDGSRGEDVDFTRCLPPTTKRPECL